MRVVIVDDQELIRRGLALLLSTMRDRVFRRGNGLEAVPVVALQQPDVVLTDARMPGMDGVGLIEELGRSHPGIPVIVLTTFDDDDLVRQALSAGAAGFMLKDSTPHDLVHAMRSVIEGGLVIDPRVARAALTPARADSAEDQPGPLAVLTRTELAVGAEVARGATNSEIAAALVIAEGTVKNHISSSLRKLGQRDRTALALLLHRYLGVPG